MAQLPPKAPTMAFHHTPPSSWVDEFLDFTSARRGNHRRSISDSIAFLETPSLLHGAASASGFDRLDDDQLMSMFSDDLAAAGNSSSAVPALHSPNSDPSSPNSDQHSNAADDDKKMSLDPTPPPVTAKTELLEDESSCKDDDVEADAQQRNSSDSTVDPKRVKRILANRQSAQRSRTEVSALSPRVAFLDHQRLILNVDNSALKQRIAALAQDKIFKDAHQEALKKEIERLRQIYHQQNMKKISSNNNNSSGEAVDNTPLGDQKMQLITS
ncbi:hypothetical protein V2J09_007290 [Rumex salicifolius]